MKVLIALLIIIPTLIAALLFTVAGFSYANPEILAAASNPVIAICCIIAGVILLLPLFVGIVLLITSWKKKK